MNVVVELHICNLARLATCTLLLWARQSADGPYTSHIFSGHSESARLRWLSIHHTHLPSSETITVSANSEIVSTRGIYERKKIETVHKIVWRTVFYKITILSLTNGRRRSCTQSTRVSMTPGGEVQH